MHLRICGGLFAGHILGESYVLLPTSISPRAMQHAHMFSSQASSMLLTEEYAMGSFIGDALGGAGFDTPGGGYDYYSSSNNRGHVMSDRRVEEQYFGHDHRRQSSRKGSGHSRSSSPSTNSGTRAHAYGEKPSELGESMIAVATHADLSHHVQLITTHHAHWYAASHEAHYLLYSALTYLDNDGFLSAGTFAIAPECL